MSKSRWVSVVLLVLLAAAIGSLVGLWTPAPVEAKLTRDKFGQHVEIVDKRSAFPLSPEWASAIAGVGAMVVAAATLFVLMGERRAGMRTELYARSVEAVGSYVAASLTLQYRNARLTSRLRNPPGRWWPQVEELADSMTIEDARGRVFAYGSKRDKSNMMFLALAQNDVADMIRQWVKEGSEPDNAEVLLENERRAVAQFMEEARQDQRLDDLHEEISSMFGRGKPKPNFGEVLEKMN